jgi:hypothetical protein
MKQHPPFLAVPIRAQIDADGALVFAEPAIWRLHVLAGGEANGPVAVPGLAALAATALQTRMRIERPVRAADEESDVELWVEAVPQNGVAELIVTGWRDFPLGPDGFRRNEDVADDRQADTDILIDPELRIVRLPSMLPHHLIGEHLGALFILEGGPEGNIPLVDALTERRPIHDQMIRLIGQDTAYCLSLEPQFSQEGSYIGHSGQLQYLRAKTSPDIATAPVGDLPMGRQLATVLKQPLSRIVANAETIGNKIHGPLRDNYAEYAQDIANAARHLSELVNDMEDLEAIDRPDFSVARDRIELGDIARRVKGLLALKASDHGIRLIAPTENETVDAIGEFRRVLQILLNLVGNAIRYAPDGSSVQLLIERQAGFASVSVVDEGQGVAPEDRQRVFEKFERLGRSGDGGSGLGLYISRRLARAMGGDLQIEEAPTGGALFRLTIPAR